MGRTTDNGIELIKQFEGFSERVYICPAGYSTIGYGHVVRSNESFNEISEQEAEELLRRDLYKYEKAVLRFISVPLDDNQFDALISFTYNLGSGALQRSTLRAKLNRGDYEGAANEFSKWCMANGRKLKGLLLRRIKERELFSLSLQV